MERRIAPRVALAIPIIAVSRDGREFWGKVWNISSGGAGLTSRGALLPGDKVELYLELPPETGLKKFNAIVTWVKKHNATRDIANISTTAGVRFTNEEDTATPFIKMCKYILSEEKERITKERRLKITTNG